MDDNVHGETGRHKTDHYKQVHAQGWQWMMPQHQMKDNPAMKLMALMAERDNAIQECNIAFSEKRAAFAERDMAIVQRDGALAERNAAIMERNNALTALRYARENGMDENCAPGSPEQRLLLQLPDSQCNHERPIHVIESYPISTASNGCIKARKTKRARNDTKDQKIKETKKGKRKRLTIGKPSNGSKCDAVGGDYLNKQITETKYQACKVQDLGLNQVPFDELMMPPPGCSCTGKLQHCYKWGNGGWQSACCTKMLSIYPLPVIPNKRHARVAGRKMSGSAFSKLLTKLAVEGYDLSVPLDLKDHWAKHGTNRYITIK